MKITNQTCTKLVVSRLKDPIWHEITIDGSQSTRLGVDKARKLSVLSRQLNK